MLVRSIARYLSRLRSTFEYAASIGSANLEATAESEAVLDSVYNFNMAMSSSFFRSVDREEAIET